MKNTKGHRIMSNSTVMGVFMVVKSDYDVILMIRGQGHLSMSP